MGFSVIQQPNGDWTVTQDHIVATVREVLAAEGTYVVHLRDQEVDVDLTGSTPIITARRDRTDLSRTAIGELATNAAIYVRQHEDNGRPAH